ncbi:uncharacterized protein LOC118406228 [Branchiostoma floridae]|uniref:Uncharacterized protein LOC118406228 n=1 Tax=Branchiostoma floridae TaxID=7739 RepID=A0A9J7HPJ2_BRAFL|nr:uncharacterized protein LOC118406228 [Branchiostoma floridae]
MGDSQPSADRDAGAFLACFQFLTLLRPGGRNRENGTKVSVGIHTVSVAEKAKYRLVIRYGKKKRCTAWKKVATQDWDFTAEFADYVPEDKVRVELQKKKKCKVKTVGVTTVDPTQALQTDKPERDWYIFDPPKKGRLFMDRNLSFLEASVAVNSPKVEKKATQEKGTTTKPSDGNEKPKVRPELTELNQHDDTVKTTSQTVGAEKPAKTDQDKPPPTASGDKKPASSSPNAASSSPSSTTTGHTLTNDGEGDVKPSRIHRWFGFFTKKNSETTASAHERVTTKPSEKTNKETVASDDRQESPSDKKESEVALKSASQPVDEEKLDKSGQDKPTASSSGSQECTHLKTTATDKSLTNGEGDGERRSERPSRFRQVVGFMRKKDNGKTTSSAVGGGESKQSTPQFTDPRCMEVITSIHKLWKELLPKRAYSKELLDYANSLRSKLEAVAPHTRDNTVLNNLVAKVPDYTHYELPEMQGLSLHELNQIHKTVVFLLEDEEKRATYIKRWLIDDICRVALEEAPQVLETTAPRPSCCAN